MNEPIFYDWQPDRIVGTSAFLREREGLLAADAMVRRALPIVHGLSAEPFVEVSRGANDEIEIVVSRAQGVSSSGVLHAIGDNRSVRGQFHGAVGTPLIGVRALAAADGDDVSVRRFVIRCPAGPDDLVVGRLRTDPQPQIDRDFHPPVQRLDATARTSTWCDRM